MKGTTNSKGVKHARGVFIGIIAAAAAATAAGAAPTTFNPWSDRDVVNVADDLGERSADAVPTTYPNESTAPSDETTTVPISGGEPPQTTEMPPPPHTEPPHTEPPHTEPPHTEPPHTEPPATVPTPDEPPAPTTTEVKTPSTLELACILYGENHNHVKCEWSGPIPDGFVKFLLLRGKQGGTGSVRFSSWDQTAHQFYDLFLEPGSYTYVIVVINADGKSIAHSSMVPITATGAP